MAIKNTVRAVLYCSFIFRGITMQDTFNSGYTKALVDVKNFLDNYSNELKYCRLYNKAGIEKIIDMLIHERESLRTTGNISNRVRYNEKEKKFEYKE